ncbi:hypothetical protein [Streptomyces sp. NPDC058614]|uniref:hypothetical protein n=1 Tax=Streptomyces sp. NPDC058614 TaxID=3346557 RepID=UPI0036690611
MTAAISLVPLATPAQAATSAWRSCSAVYADGVETPDLVATGGGNENFTGRNSLSNVNLYVKDTHADGHHVAVRLVTRQSDGSNHYWSWHHLYAGSGTDESWLTTASDSGGIRLVWREIALFEGSSRLTYCATASASNPSW